MQRITIPFAYWGGYKKFGYPNRTPFVGLAADKLEKISQVELTLGFYKDKPTFQIQTRKFIDDARSKKWHNRQRGREIVYQPADRLFAGDFSLDEEKLVKE